MRKIESFLLDGIDDTLEKYLKDFRIKINSWQALNTKDGIVLVVDFEDDA